MARVCDVVLQISHEISHRVKEFHVVLQYSHDRSHTIRVRHVVLQYRIV